MSTAPNPPTTLVEKSWDPITRIVGSLGIHTKIDFANSRVAACHSTSSIFRGYSVFMRGKDPRDAHLITSRICGICGDNHATCACYAQNMAFGVKPPPLAEWIINLGEAAEYMFDHNLFQDNLVGVDFCERMVRETNPSVLAKAEQTLAPHSAVHGFRTIADIMRALNPFEGGFYLEALQMSRLTREMFCLMEGRHAHPSTLYPGGVGTVPSVQLFNEYLVRLMKYIDFMKRSIPLHDDLFDFFYEALPGYEEVGRRRVLLGCWGSFNNPEACDYTYARMSQWGRAMYVTPGIVVDGKLITTDLVEINLGLRVLLGRSFYDDWQQGETFVKADPLGNPIDQRHPWNQTTLPKPQKRDLNGKYTWVMSPRWFDRTSGDFLPLDTGGGPLARFWVTALAGTVDMRYVKATGQGVKIFLPKTLNFPEMEFEWKIPRYSNTLERNRARTYFQAYAAGAALYFIDQALHEVHGGRLRTWTEFTVPDEAIGCGFHEAVRGLLSHHVVIRNGKIANYHPYPPTCWNASPRDSSGVPGPYEDAIQNTPLFEENGPENFKGIDIMRTVRSFDPCLPCGVHMYLGNGRVIETLHSPMFGIHPPAQTSRNRGAVPRLV
ncbi:MAG TPA: nickel-dependent hydrogenase large subunit [Pirellulales bacterium]|nr:nickel-dependent hydrogenase large subunit [Pirellulales bacterium]